MPHPDRHFFCFRSGQVPADFFGGQNTPHVAVIVLRMVEHKPTIKAGRKAQLFATNMPRKRPSDISPEEWRAYLRRYPRMSWWLGDVDGDHPDYPGMSQISQPTGNPPPTSETPANPPAWDQPPPPPQRSFLASFTSPHTPPPPLSPPPFTLWARQQTSPGLRSTSPSRDTPTTSSQQASSRSQSRSDVGPPVTSQASPPPSQCMYAMSFSQMLSDTKPVLQ